MNYELTLLIADRRGCIKKIIDLGGFPRRSKAVMKNLGRYLDQVGF